MRAKKAKKILANVRHTYDNIAEEFSQKRSHYGKEFPLYLEYFKEGGFIVDIGCGNGRFSGFLRENREKLKDYRYLGIDQNQKLLEIAKKKYPDETFAEGDLLNLPLDDESADAAILIRSFHHIPSEKLRLQSLTELQRVLKKGGILIISVWDLWKKKYWLPILKARLRSVLTLGSYERNDLFIPWSKKAKRYYHAFTMKELTKLIQKSGFTIIETPTVESVDDLIIIARK